MDHGSETTLQGYDTVGCSRLLLNLVIAGALQCMNFDSFMARLKNFGGGGGR